MELGNVYIENWIKERMSHIEFNNMKELPGFAFDIPSVPTNVSDKNLADATAGLLVLGYGQAEINHALRGVDTSAMTSQEIIKLVLRGMVK